MDTFPKIFGILNTTTDSFSDGGLYLKPERAIQKARGLRDEGASVIDIGASSSHPDSQQVSAEEEIRRLEPVIEELLSENIPISVDSYLPEVQRFCMRKGVDFLNDIQGFPNKELYGELARSECKLIVMHSVQRTGPATREKTDPQQVLNGIFQFFENRIRDLTESGIDRERLILDPGMGFFLGSNPTSSVLALKNTGQIRSRFGLPVMVCVSRKSFLGAITGRDVRERAFATLAAEMQAAALGADHIRTHDVSALADAFKELHAWQ